MGAYDNPKIVRDTSGQIYGQAIANLGQQVGGAMKSYYANQKIEQEKAQKEIERVQRIANQVETKFYDQANRNYAIVAKEDKSLLKGFQNEVGILLRGSGTEGEEGYQIGAIKAQTYLDTKNDLSKDERQYYREVVQRAKSFQNNAIAGGGQIINDLEDFSKVKPKDMNSSHYWTGANDAERDTTMITAYALNGKSMDGVESNKKIYSGPNGEMIVEVTSRVKEGSQTWDNLSEETQEELRNNNYELTWKKDMNNFTELVGEVPEGLDYNQIAENSKFQKDGKLNSNFIVGGDEGSQYETKNVLDGKEEIIKSRFLNMNKLLNDDVFKADIEGKSEYLAGMSDGELQAFMRYKMKEGSFKIQEFRERTPEAQLEYIQEALKEDFIKEKTTGPGMGSRDATPADIKYFAEQGIELGEDEKVYYQITGTNLVNKSTETATAKNLAAANKKIKDANEALSITLQEQSIPTFSGGVKSEEAVEFIETVQKFPNIKINAEDIFSVGPNQGFKIQGLKTTVTVHSGMTEPELKEAIMFANGATAEEIKNADFNKLEREDAEKKKQEEIEYQKKIDNIVGTMNKRNEPIVYE
tara:strand:+ start:881 stop:2635 length:1755 start_codon:yes stop_codon:yes gene_type:complete